MVKGKVWNMQTNSTQQWRQNDDEMATSRRFGRDAVMGKRPRKNFGERPEGWKTITLDIPEGLQAMLKARRAELPTSSWKLMGTAAMGAFIAMPKETQEALYRWAHSHELEPEKLDFQQALSIMLAMVHTVGAEDLPPTESTPKAPPSDGGREKKRGSG